MKRTSIYILLLAALFVLDHSHASAASIWLRDTPTPTDHFANNGTESLKLAGVGTINNGNYWAGMLDFQVNLVSGSSNPSNNANWFNLLTYCIDPFRTLIVGPANGTGDQFNRMSLTGYFTTFTPSVVNVATTVNRIERLWAIGFNDSYNSAVKAAAFQFLIWEYIADSGSFNLTDGIVKISNSAVLNQATAYHNQASNSLLSTTLQAIQGTNRQSFLLPEARISTNETIPEPGTYALIGAGLLAVVLKRHKK